MSRYNASRLTLPVNGSSSLQTKLSLETKPSLTPTAKGPKSRDIVVISDDSDTEGDYAEPSRSRPAGNGHANRKGKEKAWGVSEYDEAGNGGSGLDLEARDALKVALAKLDTEIASIKAQLVPLQTLHTSLLSERHALENQLKTASHPQPSTTASTVTSTATLNYQSSSFPFSTAILQTLKNNFNLSSFRLCQEGVINAAVDDRDIICVMPTGGGKSLTYQLPAVMGRGLTVVISPLLALIWDQVRSLKEIGVEAVMLTGAISAQEQREIFNRMTGPSSDAKEIRMCYVTPEKVAKSKPFMGLLEKLNQAGRLRRFVIDEAHCCSQMGHDFRPDYKALSVLKRLFPRVPIQAVTATLSSKTLPDLLKILGLAPITDGLSANTTGTVFFSAPLFRPNLHYKVLPKPAGAKAAIAAMGRWIQANHPGESGIIYCLSKKDAEIVSRDLAEWSGGAIKAGVYHAGIDDSQKEQIHMDWREGIVNCICATIAFGMGIDKSDVRYVIHHSTSKSLEGYYQETGRAGRDGKKSDCVLFYRGQDVSRMTSLVYKDTDGSSKLYEMLRFAQDLKTCRKVAFAKYFSASARLSVSAWDTASALGSSSGTTSTCGICDNCRRPSSSIVTRDVTPEAWKILRAVVDVGEQNGRVTLANLGDLVRGMASGSFAVVGRGKQTGEKATVDMDKFGGKIDMSKDDVERLLIHMLLSGYLRDSLKATSYMVNVYMKPSDSSTRLWRHTRDDVEAGLASVTLECIFPVKGKRGLDEDDDGDEDDDDEGGKKKKAKSTAKAKATPKPRAKPAAKRQSASTAAAAAALSRNKASSKPAKLVYASEDEDDNQGREYFDEIFEEDIPSDVDRDAEMAQADMEREERRAEAVSEWDDGYDEMMGDGWVDEGDWKVHGPVRGGGSGAGARGARGPRAAVSQNGAAPG